VKAPPKKDGQGGGYTWGGAKDTGKESQTFEPHDAAQMMKEALQAGSPTTAPGSSQSEDFHYKDSDFPPMDGSSGKAPPMSPKKQAMQKNWEMDVATDPNMRG
jgi:hypothetical protein